MNRTLTMIVALAGVVAGSWAYAPREASATDLAMIGGHDTAGQGVGEDCSATTSRNCNWPNAPGQCDKNAPWCITPEPPDDTCTITGGVLHPCQPIPPIFPACAHAHDVTC